MIRIAVAMLTIVSSILPVISIYYFMKLMKLIKVKRGNSLVFSSIILLTGYLFFMLPWIFIGEDIYEVRIFSYSVILSGLLLLVYTIIRIYMDWSKVIR